MEGVPACLDAHPLGHLRIGASFPDLLVLIDALEQDDFSAVRFGFGSAVLQLNLQLKEYE